MNATSQDSVRLPLRVRLCIIPPAWLLARLPHLIRATLASVLGTILYYGFRRRRRILLSNLRHAYPDCPERQLRAMARQSCAGLVEMGLFALCGPFLSRRWVRRNLLPTERLLRFFEEQRNHPRPAILLAPHTALLEAPLALSKLVDLPEIGAFYRPLNQSGLNAYLEWSRARSGIRLLSRKAGLTQALRFLRQGKLLGIPFDQNAGPPGAAVLFLDRVCSATDLPGSLAGRFGAEVYVLFPVRHRGWKMDVDLVRLETDKTPESVTLASHRWLESMLRSDSFPGFRADWMWNHNRWKTIWDVHHCFSPVFKKSFLPAELPRRTPLIIRLPDDFSDITPLVALLQALRHARRDAAFTVAGPGSLLEAHADTLAPLTEAVLPVPADANRQFWSARADLYPEIWISLAGDSRHDREGIWLRAPVRLGLGPAGSSRPQLTACYKPPTAADWAALSTTARWLTFAAHFGHASTEAEAGA